MRVLPTCIFESISQVQCLIATSCSYIYIRSGGPWTLQFWRWWFKDDVQPWCCMYFSLYRTDYVVTSIDLQQRSNIVYKIDYLVSCSKIHCIRFTGDWLHRFHNNSLNSGSFSNIFIIGKIFMFILYCMTRCCKNLMMQIVHSSPLVPLFFASFPDCFACLVHSP